MKTRLFLSLILLLLIGGCGQSNGDLETDSREYQLVQQQLTLLQESGLDAFWQQEVDPACRGNTLMRQQLNTLLKLSDLKLISVENVGKNSIRVTLEAGTNDTVILQSFLLNRIDGKLLWATGI